MSAGFAFDKVYFQPGNRSNRDLDMEHCTVTDYHPPVPEDLARPPPKSLGPSAVPLSRLFGHSSLQLMPGEVSTSNVTFEFCLFAPDGHVYGHIPGNGMLDHFDFAAAVTEDPKHTGYYRVSGSKIEFVWAGRRPQASEFRKTGDVLPFLGTSWYPVDFSRARQSKDWLVGEFRRQVNGAITSNVSAVGQRWFTFRLNGTFETASIGTTVSNLPWGNGSRSTKDSGTYELSGTTLILHFPGGRVERHTAIPYAKGAIIVDGSLYIHP